MNQAPGRQRRSTHGGVDGRGGGARAVFLSAADDPASAPVPSHVVVRQWSRRCFAAYVFDGDRFGRFVGTESSRRAANVLGNRSLFDTENRCGVTEIGSHPTSVEGGHVREYERRGRHTASTPNPAKTSHRPAERR